MKSSEITIQKIIHRAETRGRSKYEWLDSKHNFSFAGYSDQERIHFGALRVLNDDIVKPGQGFGLHPHDNMEIISIPLKGALKHQDSMKHEQEINENEVQVMSAGTGIFHSEYNASDSEEVNFLQLWIFPNERNVKPVYDQKWFDPANARDKWQLLVTSMEEVTEGVLNIHQDAKISRALLSEGKDLDYSLNPGSYGSFIFVVSGEINIEGESYSERDAVGLAGISGINIKALRDAYILNIEVPDINF
jgi:redox-sensitive bicupin YhaK (pirin superfamily)